MSLFDPSNNDTPASLPSLKDTEVTNRSIWINSQYAIKECHNLSDELVRTFRQASHKYLKQEKSRQKIRDVIAIIVGTFAKQMSLGYLRKEYVAIPTGKSSSDALKLTGFSGEWLASGLDFLQSCGLVKKAFPHFYDSSSGDGRVAKYEASQALIYWLEDYGLLRLRYPESTRFFVEPEPLQSRIKIEDKVYTSVEDDPSVETVEWLAKTLSNTRITIAGISHQGLLTSFDYKRGRSKVLFGKSRLVRTYSKQRGLGGRFYCNPLQELSKHVRPYLLFDGAKTVELDYKSMHLCLLYRRAGQVLEYERFKNCDPYDIGEKYDLDRAAIKECFVAAVGETSFASFMNHSKFHGSKHVGFSTRDRQRALECLLDAHPLLDDFLFRNLSSSLQHEDSEIALSVMSNLKELDIPCIPIHESFILKKKHEPELKRIMLEQFPGALVA